MMKYANQKLFSDVHPFEIIREISSKTMEIRAMDSVTKDSNSFEQDYHYSSNSNNPIIRIRQHKNGTWKDVNGHRYSISEQPIKYHDYGF